MADLWPKDGRPFCPNVKGRLKTCACWICTSSDLYVYWFACRIKVTIIHTVFFGSTWGEQRFQNVQELRSDAAEGHVNFPAGSAHPSGAFQVLS